MPVYLVGGWYDSWGGNTSRNYQVLSQRLKSPVYLIFGPWTHGQQAYSSHGQVNFGKDAAIADQWAWRTAWFNRWLKEQPDALGTYPTFKTRVRIFVMGTGSGGKDAQGLLMHGGSWRDESEWPLARTRDTRYFLHRGGGLATTPPHEATASTSYRFDPKNPVPNIGGNLSSSAGAALAGAWNQKGGPHVWNMPEPVPLSARNDVLVFQTEPLAEDTEVTGEIVMQLYASSDALDTDFTAKLVDVYPPSSDWPAGFDLNVEDGIVRARFRDDLKVQKLMTPGEIYQFTVRMYPTSNVFKKGHRIRVDVSSSNFPRFDVNPNTGEPLNDNRSWRVATNTIYHDSAHPSHILLPVIPKGRP
jgi:putative CocE/NonD family hydrolase